MSRPLTAPAAERNKGPILKVLRRVLPENGLVLEIASGTGQHVVHFARELPNLTWQPSDLEVAARASVQAWINETGLSNVRRAVSLDVQEDAWPIDRADAVVCINMVHIAPWSATVGLVRGAARILGGGGILFLYGPYRRFSKHTAPSNEVFDAQLRTQNSDWGVRDVEAVSDLARAHGIWLEQVIDMPANNLSLVFRAKPALA